MVMSAGEGNGWPPLEELRSEEAVLIRQALNSLGSQQLEILGSIDNTHRKIANAESHIDEAVVQVRAEQRSEFKGVRQQLGTFGKTIDNLVERVNAFGESASQTREIVESMRKLLKELKLSDRFV